MQNARILPNQPALATTEQCQAGVQDHLHVLGIGEDVGGGGHIDDSPGKSQGQRKSESEGWQFSHVSLSLTL